jgi:hypothetical protein
MPQSHSSSDQYSTTYHYSHRYLDLEMCKKAMQRREDFATAVNLLGNTREALTDMIFLDYLFQSIQDLENTLENQKRFAMDRISRVIAKESSTEFYRWVRHGETGREVPVGSDHTPPDSSTQNSGSSSNESLPIQPKVQLPLFVEEEDTRRILLEHQYLEDSRPGSSRNPIVIEDSDDEDSIQGIEEDEEGLVLRFAHY